MSSGSRNPVLAGNKALVIGIANEDSIAYGCAKAFSEQAAEVAITYLNDKARPYVEPLARELGAELFMPLDVSNRPGAGLTPWCIPSPSHPRTISRDAWSTARPRVSRSPWMSPATRSSAWPDSPCH